MKPALAAGHRLVVLSVVLPILPVLAPVCRAADRLAGLEVPTVVVTGSRFEQPATEAAVGVTVIDREEIERYGVQTVPEVLARQAGIVTRDNSGSPNRQVDLRGFGINGDQNTLVLVDGQRLSENELTPADLASVSLADVERIEILRGSGAVLYGGGATGGTIHIITRRPAAGDRQARLAAGVGSLGTAGVAASASVGSEWLAAGVGASRRISDNYRDNNDLQQNNLRADLRWFAQGGPVNLSVLQSRQSLRLPGARSRQQLVADPRGTGTPNDFLELDATRTTLGTVRELGTGSLALEASHRQRHSESFQFGGLNTIDSRVTSLAPRLRQPFTTGPLAHSLVAGADLEWWDYDNVITGFAYRGDGRQTVRAWYLHDTVQLPGGTTLGAGLRTQSMTHEVNEPGVTGGQDRHVRAAELSLRQPLGGGWSAYARGGRSFRVANIDEVRRFGFGPVNFLEPQTSSDREAGVEALAPGMRLRAAIWSSQLHNEIYFDPGTFSNVNLPPTRRAGLELDAAAALGGRWDLALRYARTRARFREGSFAGSPVGGNDIPLVPGHTASATLSTRLDGDVRLAATVTRVGTQRFDNDQANTFGEKMPAYTLADFTASWEGGPWRVNGSLLNAFDRRYFSYAIAGTAPGAFNAYPAAGRTVFVSAEYRFGLR